MALAHKCGPCSLCKQESTRYTHPPKMKPIVFELVCSCMEEEQQLDNMSCICHARYKQAIRNVGTNNFNPRWRDKLTSKKGCCGVAGYNEDAYYRRTQMASPTSLQSILGKHIISGSEQDTPLCKGHYTYMQNALRAPRPCSSCNSKPKWGEQHTRHCPEPELVNSYLTTIM